MRLLLLLPLFIMLLLGTMTMLGMGDTTPMNMSDTFHYNYGVEFTDLTAGGTTTGYLYDETGFPMLNLDLTPTQGAGAIEPYYRSTGRGALAVWHNATSTYFIFTDPLIHDDITIVTMAMLISSNPSGSDNYGHFENSSYTLTDSLGWMALVGVILALGTLAGIKFFGTGESEISVELLLKVSFFISIWVVLSISAYAVVLGTGQILLFAMYSGLTLMYAIGIISSVGGGGAND